LESESAKLKKRKSHKALEG